MNAYSGNLLANSEIDQGAVPFYRLRSSMLDCFADIERAVMLYLADGPEKNVCLTAPLGKKIEAAKKVPAGPQRSTDLKKLADTELNKLADLLFVRADIVHSRMDIAITTNCQFIAIFKNVKDAKLAYTEAFVFDEKELGDFVNKLCELEKTITKALKAKNSVVPSKSKASK